MEIIRIKDSKLIGIFMGGKTSSMTNIVLKQHEIWLPEHGICRWDTIELGKGKTLKYHKSWDWLMPVVEKIKSTEHFVRIDSGFTEISDENGEIIIDSSGLIPIEYTYNAVVEFIKWYNVQC